jgi:hypothetical protein
MALTLDTAIERSHKSCPVLSLSQTPSAVDGSCVFVYSTRVQKDGTSTC